VQFHNHHAVMLAVYDAAFIFIRMMMNGVQIVKL
jgi:hypothetical protein